MSLALRSWCSCALPSREAKNEVTLCALLVRLPSWDWFLGRRLPARMWERMPRASHHCSFFDFLGTGIQNGLQNGRRDHA